MNSEAAKERSKRYYHKHKERLIKASCAWRNADPRRHLIHGARNRARSGGFPCSITIDDILIPKKCPILGIELKRGKGKVQNSSPSLDRIDVNKGYVKGNIAVISYAANRLKSNMSKQVLRKLYNYVFVRSRSK